jgi:hypothetical protein
MEFQAKNLILKSDPVMFGKVTKVNLIKEKYKKIDGKWELIGQDEFEMVAFAEVGTSLMMEAAGVEIDVEGKIGTREFTAKNGKTYNNIQLIINKYNHATNG